MGLEEACDALVLSGGDLMHAHLVCQGADMFNASLQDTAMFLEAHGSALAQLCSYRRRCCRSSRFVVEDCVYVRVRRWDSLGRKEQFEKGADIGVAGIVVYGISVSEVHACVPVGFEPAVCEAFQRS